MSNLFIFDFETTGVHRFNDRPVQLGLIDGSGRIVMNTYVDPGIPIPKGAAEVHGITDEQVKNAPDYVMAVWQLWTVMEQLSEGKPYILSGYNVSQFDIPMAVNIFPGGSAFWVLDILDLIYRTYPTLVSKKLGDVHRKILERELVGAHGALQDCIGSLALLEHIAEGKDLQEMAEKLSVPTVYEIMPIGKYAGFPVAKVPKHWAAYMKENAKDMRPDLRVTVDWILEN